jgi:hypothetical protein
MNLPTLKATLDPQTKEKTAKANKANKFLGPNPKRDLKPLSGVLSV